MTLSFQHYSLTALAVVLISGCQADVDTSGPQAPILRGIADLGLDGAGVAFNDYDGDGDADIYITNNDSGTFGLEFRNRLWENDGNGYFTDVAQARGAANEGGLGRGISFGDYDNDGDG